jgi:hypothetical protein
MERHNHTELNNVIVFYLLHNFDLKQRLCDERSNFHVNSFTDL